MVDSERVSFVRQGVAKRGSCPRDEETGVSVSVVGVAWVAEMSLLMHHHGSERGGGDSRQSVAVRNCNIQWEPLIESQVRRRVSLEEGTCCRPLFYTSPWGGDHP